MARKRDREAPPLAELPVNTDPLLIYDREKKPAGHVLRDQWKGCSAFLVCGGPSIKEVPYERLAERGVMSLGINNVSGMVPVSAMTFSDPPEKFHHGVFLDGKILKLVPVHKMGKRIRAKGPDGRFRFTSLRVMDCPNVWGFRRDLVWEPREFLTSEGAMLGNNKTGVAQNGRPKIIFTFFFGFRLLHYLGVRRIYLLGADFSMKSGGRQYGNYAFWQAGSGDGNNNHYRLANKMLIELRPYLEKAGLYTFNCNPRSRLEAFDHVPFDRAMADCKGHVPEEPFDLKGWYEKVDSESALANAD